MRVLCLLLTLMSCSVLSAQPMEQPPELNPYLQFKKDMLEEQGIYLKDISRHQQILMRDLEVKMKQQQWQTTAIAIMVFIMVAMGLWLSYLQFKGDGKNDTKSSVHLKLGNGGIEINSSVIGLSILAMSFWFFQTYIDRVYSVEVKQFSTIDFSTFGSNQ